ncbi:MAG: hypothetical protein FJ102_25795 [Deltaproteobacteria bacterium]|nr:hypothetical protein [Deltaproteobacteria bacterium]
MFTLSALVLACAHDYGAIRSFAPGPAPGEFYALVEAGVVTYDQYGRGSAAPTDLSLIRCAEEETSKGWYTSCHRVLSVEEARLAAQATGQVGFAHTREAKPGD